MKCFGASLGLPSILWDADFWKGVTFAQQQPETGVTKEDLLALLFPKQIFFHAVGQDGADPVTQQRKQSSQGYGQLRLNVK